jgi:hypothetical protein
LKLGRQREGVRPVPLERPGQLGASRFAVAQPIVSAASDLFGTVLHSGHARALGVYQRAERGEIRALLLE